MAAKYHYHYREPVGARYVFGSTESHDEMIELVRKANDVDEDGYSRSNMANLTVIWGEQLEFEPATVVQTWRVKHESR